MTILEKARKHIVDLRDENFVRLYKMREEAKNNKDEKTHYNTLIYDSRNEIYSFIIDVLEGKEKIN